MIQEPKGKLLSDEIEPMRVGEIISELDDEELLRLQGRTLALYENICTEIELREEEDE